jgi:cyclophilin family peptidyl-prolyl cis-trans isomerase
MRHRNRSIHSGTRFAIALGFTIVSSLVLSSGTNLSDDFASALGLNTGEAHAGDEESSQAKSAASENEKSKDESKAKKTTEQDTAMKGISMQIEAGKVDKSDKSWRTKLKKPEVAKFDPKMDYFAKMETNKGLIVIKMYPDIAPMHVTSWAYLTELGFYDGLAFHRVITEFMAQGGCPLGTGTGGPGYKYAGEFDAKVKHTKPGLLSMANAGPGTDGSQFFLTFKATPWLDGKHTVFGEVVEGMDVLKQLEAAGSQSGETSEPLLIEKMTMEVKAKES